MGKPNYVCSLCKKDFSRKSNANRHDLSQHQGKAEIIRIGEHVLRKRVFTQKQATRVIGLIRVHKRLACTTRLKN